MGLTLKDGHEWYNTCGIAQTIQPDTTLNVRIYLIKVILYFYNLGNKVWGLYRNYFVRLSVSPCFSLSAAPP